MRILHVTPTYLPAYRYGGPIPAIHALAKYAVRNGAEVTVFTTAMDGPGDLNVPLGEPVDVDGVKVYYFKPTFRRWFYSLDMHRALRSRAGEFDVIHGHYAFTSASTLAARAARRAGVPYVITPHGILMKARLDGKSPIKKRLYLELVEKSNLRGAAAVHFTTAVEEAEYRGLGLPLKKALVIPIGLDPELLSPGDPGSFRQKFGISKDRKIIFFIGRLSWEKGLDTLIEAFAGLRKDMPEAILVLAGPDDRGYRAKVLEMIEKEGVGGEVILTGELLGEEKSSAFLAADVSVLLSHAENFSVSVAEALYFGVPVVLSDAVGLSVAVKDAGAGFVIKKDALQAKFALFKILKDRELALEMGERGRRLITEKFSYDAIVKELLRAYKELQ